MMLCDFKGYVNKGHDLVPWKCLLLEPCIVTLETSRDHHAGDSACWRSGQHSQLSLPFRRSMRCERETSLEVGPAAHSSLSSVVSRHTAGRAVSPAKPIEGSTADKLNGYFKPLVCSNLLHPNNEPKSLLFMQTL